MTKTLEQHVTRERPILFSGEMVRAILAGKKAQTRRIVKPQPDLSVLRDQTIAVEFRRCPVLGPSHHGRSEWGLYPASSAPASVPIYGYECPFGKPGHRLWVRESFCHWDTDRQSRDAVWYAADPREDGERDIRWKPSIHMPRWASRITLEITDVRVERLQSIGESDAIAEGIQNVPNVDSGMWFTSNGWDRFYSARGAYAALWDSINGDGSWNLNPWCWCISFLKL